MRGNVLIKTPGELYSSSSEGVVVSADGIKDYRLNKNQEEINKEFEALIHSSEGASTDNIDITKNDKGYLRFANRVFDTDFGYYYWPETLKYNVPYVTDIETVNVRVTSGTPNYLLVTGVYFNTQLNNGAGKFVLKAGGNYYDLWEAYDDFLSSTDYNNLNTNNVIYLISQNKLGYINIEGNNVTFYTNNVTAPKIYAVPSNNELGVYGVNSVNIIRYPYNLQNRTINLSNIDDYMVLSFQGGSISNGKIIGNSKIYLDLAEIDPSQDWSVFVGNFANYGTVFPTNPYVGLEFYNTYYNKTLIWNGANWLDFNGYTPYQRNNTTFPTNLKSTDKGALFYKENEGLHYWTGKEWKLIGNLNFSFIETLPETGTSNTFYINSNNDLYIWKNNTWEKIGGESEIHRGTTSQRPSNLTHDDEGYMYYDTTLHKPIFWNGEYWIDANGQVAAVKSGNILDRPTNLSYPNDTGYTFFDTIDNVLLYWSLDKNGNDIWKDGMDNDYSIIEFTSILNLSASDFDSHNITGARNTWVEESLVNPKSIYYLGDNLKVFGACKTDSSEIPSEFYSNWSSNLSFRERKAFEDITGLISDTGNIHTTPYFKNLENSKLYRYNKKTEKLEEINLERKTSGTIFDRPTDLTDDLIGFEFYDTVNDITVYYLGQENGIDIWKSKRTNLLESTDYSIIPFDDFIDSTTLNSSNVLSLITTESESGLATEVVDTVLFSVGYLLFIGWDNANKEAHGNWRANKSGFLNNKYYNNLIDFRSNEFNNISQSSYFYCRETGYYCRYNPTTKLLCIVDEETAITTDITVRD